ncbi:DUF1648 domain-containing protein [Haloarcula sp. S1CR25-12]|uniref:DUF1648 domain-containing protein n=1 Tax=Haloarcula saliterrae TaxID=2950534 RepID=A0ABU2FIA6_9EURY|nr:DUF1648 domain-containing protein [Haloarcula sp. S1CR25-12]MDS0261511.1 DUF1648 domain-containing protein [Haloarcula sp. S1CR25-12]
MPRSRATRLSTALVALSVLGSLALWPRLPAEMAIHFSASGTPDNFVPRVVGAFLLPAVMVLTLLVVRWAMRSDPPADPRLGRLVTVATVGFLSALHGLVLGWNLGYPVPFDLVLVVALVLGVALCGYVIRRESVSPG